MESLWVAIVGGVALVVATIVPIFVSGRQRRKDKLENWQREDAVAERLLAANNRVEEASRLASQQLTEIHLLVNSQLTAALEAELKAFLIALASMNDASTLRQRAGLSDSTDEPLTVRRQIEDRIKVLRTTLRERPDG